MRRLKTRRERVDVQRMPLLPPWARAFVRLQRPLWALLLVLACAAPVAAVIPHPDGVSGEDPTVAPPDDPGWDNVGTFLGNWSGGSAVYLGTSAQGEPWILTAGHLGTAAIHFRLGGVDYFTDLRVDFTNPNQQTADLRAWRLTSRPPVPQLAGIIESTPASLSEVTTIALGRSEGAFTCWNASWNEIGGCTGAAHRGYKWTSNAQRWGTNLVEPSSAAIEAALLQLGLDEEVFVTRFDDPGTPLESQVASSDSGGAVFIEGTQEWELAGIGLALFAPPSSGRPSQIAVLNEDLSIYVDLSAYRDQILEQTGVYLPEPSGGLVAGLMLLAVLAQRRR